MAFNPKTSADELRQENACQKRRIENLQKGLLKRDAEVADLKQQLQASLSQFLDDSEHLFDSEVLILFK